jgi:hypothetical protein
MKTFMSILSLRAKKTDNNNNNNNNNNNSIKPIDFTGGFRISRLFIMFYDLI